MYIIKTYNHYRIGSHPRLGEAQLIQIMELFQRPAAATEYALGGRVPITFASIEGIGPVAVKVYTRGGLINQFSKHHYLRTGEPRSQKEFNMLAAVRKLGINAPEPIAFAYRGRFLYSGWLITRKVDRPLSLAQLCFDDADRCRLALIALAEQVEGLIKHRVVHVDLHPGNVLVDGRDRIYLIDFDRARIGKMNKAKLRARYLLRWKQAIARHDLPMFLNEGLREHLVHRPANP